MLPPDSCHNGCCRSQPCLNGATCTEHCNSPKEKFSCKCTDGYGGTVCEKELTSCMEIFKASKTIPVNGVYKIKFGSGGVLFPVYCSFRKNPTRTRVWTLIESFALDKLGYFKFNSFHVDLTYNPHDPPSWNKFRIGKTRMTYIHSKSTLFMATCDFNVRMNGSLTPDVLVGRLSDVDILTYKYEYAKTCQKYIFIDVKGHQCRDCTANTEQNHGGYNTHFCIDVTRNMCDFNVPSNTLFVRSFGFYQLFDTAFTCTASPQSTTQWWLGDEL